MTNQQETETGHVVFSVVRKGEELRTIKIGQLYDESEIEEDLSSVDKTENQNLDANNQKAFRREPCSADQLLQSLSKLSFQWTTLSLAFFDAIPNLTAVNFDIATDELKQSVVKIAKDLSVDKDETDLENGETLVEYKIPEGRMGVVLKQMGKSTHAMQAASLMSNATLGALLSEYELFLSNLLRLVARFDPTTFIRDDHQISVKELEKYDSFEAFLRDEIEASIAKIMYENSHFKMLKWIENKYEINLTSDKNVVADFVEVCQRRHLIAHSGGRVNKQYLEICKKAGVDDTNLDDVGETVVVGAKYIRRATARVYVMGLFTLHMLWHKLLPEHVDESHSSLLTASHDFLDSDLTKMASRVIHFAQFTDKKMSEEVKAAFVVNSALCYLTDPLLEETERAKGVEKELRKKDWSVLSPLLRLVLACLRKDFSKIDELTDSAKRDGLSFTDAMTWVVFRDARNELGFTKHFEKT